MTDNCIKILLIEHDSADIDLLQYQISKGGFNYLTEIVATETAYIDALHRFQPHIILSDYSLPSFDGATAFSIRQKFAPHVPFIFVSGTIGEEKTVELLKNGVTDYVLKDKLFTINNKISRALQECKEKQDKIAAEEKLVKNERYLRSIIENNADGIALLNDKGEFIDISPNCMSILGYPRHELMGPMRFDLIYPDDRKILQDTYYETLQKPKKNKLFQYRFIKPDESIIWLEGKYSNHLHDTDVNAIILNYRDITEKKKIEDEIIQLNAELEQRVALRTAELLEANRQLEAFSYSVSHDLRSPIRSIYGFTQLLQKRYSMLLDADGEELLGAIKSTTAKMQTLVDELLTFSRLGKKAPEKQLIDMHKMVQEIWQSMNNNEPVPHNIIIHPLHTAMADETLITQVWVNLISNAVKYSSKVQAPVIEIGYNDHEHETEYFVKDNGAGFDMEYAGKLFNAFQRMHDDGEFEGIGIGLAIVKRIIDSHAGRVWAKAKENQGATFYFTLPKVPVPV